MYLQWLELTNMFTVVCFSLFAILEFVKTRDFPVACRRVLGTAVIGISVAGMVFLARLVLQGGTMEFFNSNDVAFWAVFGAIVVALAVTVMLLVSLWIRKTKD